MTLINLAKTTGLLLVVGVLATGCSTIIGSEEVPPPVGIGPEIDDLKRSPCACMEIPQDYRNWHVPT